MYVDLTQYREMGALLEPINVAMLRALGYTARDIRALRRRRVAQFRALLKSLKADFMRVYRTAKAEAVFSEVDETELVQAIVRQRICFFQRLAGVELRLLLFAVGADVRVDVGALLGAAVMESQ